MSSSYQYVSESEADGILVLSLLLQRVESYETAEGMGRELVAAVQGKPAPQIVLDMGKLVYMSSVGYGPLISLRSYIREAGGRLVLCQLSPVVKEMFETTRLLINPQSPKSLFEFTDSREKALEMIRA
jgi:stage II sporulation protein AA (anti-sigma F factor antagonist)